MKVGYNQLRYRQICISTKQINVLHYNLSVYTPEPAVPGGSQGGTLPSMALTAWLAATLVSQVGLRRRRDVRANKECSSWGCSRWTSPSWVAAPRLVTPEEPVSNKTNSLSNLNSNNGIILCSTFVWNLWQKQVFCQWKRLITKQISSIYNLKPHFTDN